MAWPSWHHSSSSLGFTNCWLSCSPGVTLFYHQLDLAFQNVIQGGSITSCYEWKLGWFTLQNYWLSLLAMKWSWRAGSKEKWCCKTIFISMARCYKRWVKVQKELAISDSSGIWSRGVHISCHVNNWVKLMWQDLNPGVQGVWGIHTSCSQPHVCYVGIWTWGIHTHRSLVKFFSCCEVQCKITEHRSGSNQLKCLACTLGHSAN